MNLMQRKVKKTWPDWKICIFRLLGMVLRSIMPLSVDIMLSTWGNIEMSDHKEC